MAIDACGNIIGIDARNNCIRYINFTTKTVSTLAGCGTAGYADGEGSQAKFNFPIGLAVDDKGNILVADQYNHCIRCIRGYADGGVVTVSTLAGVPGKPGRADGEAKKAKFHSPNCVLVDRLSGDILVVDNGGDRVRRLCQGSVTTFNCDPKPKRFAIAGGVAQGLRTFVVACGIRICQISY